jgi:hypothetical protein
MVPTEIASLYFFSKKGTRSGILGEFFLQKRGTLSGQKGTEPLVKPIPPSSEGHPKEPPGVPENTYASFAYGKTS